MGRTAECIVSPIAVESIKHRLGALLRDTFRPIVHTHPPVNDSVPSQPHLLYPASHDMQQLSSTAGSVARFAPRGVASRSRAALKVSAVKVGDAVRSHMELREWPSAGALWPSRIRLVEMDRTFPPPHAAPDTLTLLSLPLHRRPSLRCVTRCETALLAWLGGCWEWRACTALGSAVHCSALPAPFRVTWLHFLWCKWVC